MTTQAAVYRSPLRAAQAAATHDRIVEACVAIMRRGAELTYAAVAGEAAVQERTVYRHFPTKPDLEAAVWNWIVENLTQADLAAADEPQLIAAMRASFAGFDRDAVLIQAMLHSPQGLTVRRRQQGRRRAMFEACVQSAAPGSPSDRRAQAAAVLQILYSASTWEQLRVFCGMDAAAAADTVAVGIRAFLEGLRREASNSNRSAATRRRRERP